VRPEVAEQAQPTFTLCGSRSSLIQTKYYSSQRSLILEFHSGTVTTNHTGFRGIYRFLNKGLHINITGIISWLSTITILFLPICHARVARRSDGPAPGVGLSRVRKCTNMSGSGRVQFDLMTKIYCKIMRCSSYYNIIIMCVNIFHVFIDCAESRPTVHQCELRAVRERLLVGGPNSDRHAITPQRQHCRSYWTSSFGEESWPD